jgi:reactive intermediate/imine deaminase
MAKPDEGRRTFLVGTTLAAGAAASAALVSQASAESSRLRFVNPSTMWNAAARGFSQVVQVTGPARTIYLSGQLGITPDGKFAGASGDFRAQATQCFENIKEGLAAAEANFEHVVKLTIYFVDMADLPAFFEVRDRYVNTKAPPASTAVQIAKLAREGALCEIEAIAVVPQT